MYKHKFYSKSVRKHCYAYVVKYAAMSLDIKHIHYVMREQSLY